MSPCPPKRNILCLHGKGTSAKILASQTTSLREELSSDFTFVFLDGELPSDPYPTIDRYWRGPYWSHYDSATGRGLASAVDRVLAFAESYGPFEGIFGFSQGAALAAAVLVTVSSSKPTDGTASAAVEGRRASFNFGIFFCGGVGPWRDADALTRMGAAPLVTVPSAHFVGTRDSHYRQGLALHAATLQDKASLWEFDGGHYIPRTSGATQKIASMIRSAASFSEAGEMQTEQARA